jgi:DNA-binding transcriptional MocR family regulator
MGDVVPASEVYPCDVERAFKALGRIKPRVSHWISQTGRLEQHAKDLTQVMRRYRDVMMENLQRHLPDTKVRNPEGGYFLWVLFRQQIDVERLSEIALRKGVTIFSGKAASPNDAPPNYIRLAYSYL